MSQLPTLGLETTPEQINDCPISFFFFLYFFSFFNSFFLIVCNSYHISLRPTSVASNSAVGKPSVCCRHFIGFQGGGLLLFSVILARQ